jgi:hypothetical protein
MDNTEDFFKNYRGSIICYVITITIMTLVPKYYNYSEVIYNKYSDTNIVYGVN